MRVPSQDGLRTHLVNRHNWRVEVRCEPYVGGTKPCTIKPMSLSVPSVMAALFAACLTKLYRNRRKRDARIGSYVEPYPPHQ